MRRSLLSRRRRAFGDMHPHAVVFTLHRQDVSLQGSREARLIYAQHMLLDIEAARRRATALGRRKARRKQTTRDVAPRAAFDIDTDRLETIFKPCAMISAVNALACLLRTKTP